MHISVVAVELFENFYSGFDTLPGKTVTKISGRVVSEKILKVPCGSWDKIPPRSGSTEISRFFQAKPFRNLYWQRARIRCAL
jgi:hypothetical protein